MERSANVPSRIPLSVTLGVDAPVMMDESAQVRRTQFSQVKPISREFLNPSGVEEAHLVSASQGPSAFGAV